MEQIPFPNKRYQIIYADPPWMFNFQKRKGLSDVAKQKLYKTMTGKEIIDLPVSKISDNNSILFLWVMSSELPLALDVIRTYPSLFLNNHRAIILSYTPSTLSQCDSWQSQNTYRLFLCQ